MNTGHVCIHALMRVLMVNTHAAHVRSYAYQDTVRNQESRLTKGSEIDLQSHKMIPMADYERQVSGLEGDLRTQQRLLNKASGNLQLAKRTVALQVCACPSACRSLA